MSYGGRMFFMGLMEKEDVRLLLAKTEIEEKIISLTNLKENTIKLFVQIDIGKVYDIINDGKNFELIFISGNKTKITFLDKHNNKMLLEM